MNSDEIAVLSDDIVNKFKNIETFLSQRCSQKEREV